MQGDIRESLATEDAKYRKRAGILANIKLFPVDRYAETYERQALDPQDVSTAYRRAGVPTPLRRQKANNPSQFRQTGLWLAFCTVT